jgi:hypothetical protein
MDGDEVRISLPRPHLRRGRAKTVLWRTVEAVTYCSPALVPPCFAFALALPVLALLPRLHPRVPLRPCCVVRDAQASSRAGTRTHPHTRRDGKARVRVQVPVRANPALAIALPPRARPAQYAYVLRRTLISRRACTCAYGAHHILVLALLLVIERSRRDVRAYSPRRRILLPTRIWRAHAPRIWVYFCVWMRTHASLEVGMEREKARGCVVGARIFCPLPPLQSISLSFSSNSIRSLFSAPFDVCPASHPHPHTHGHPAQRNK